MRLKRLGVLSVALTLAAVYAVLGLLVGILFAMISVLGGGLAAMASAEGESLPPLFGLLFGAGAVVILPIFYGIIGFIGGAIAAGIYNLMAKLTGGIEMTLE
jgi:hypothetical protein